MRSFKLYPDYGEVTVSLSSHSSPPCDKVTKKSLKAVQKFHCFLFSHILGKPMKFKPGHADGRADGYFVVLVKNNGRDVDFDSMKDALRLKDSLARSRRNVRIEEDMVVSKNYVDSKQRFAVFKVRHGLSPLSAFPDKSKAKTYKSYFRQHYGKRITDKDQPLIEVKDISGRVNFLVDRKLFSKSKREAIHLVPELCDVLPIRGSLLSVSLMLPSILHRVNTLLLVGDVKSMIAGVPDHTDESSLPAIGAEGTSDEKSLLHLKSSSAAAEVAMDVDDDDDDDVSDEDEDVVDYDNDFGDDDNDDDDDDDVDDDDDNVDDDDDDDVDDDDDDVDDDDDNGDDDDDDDYDDDYDDDNLKSLFRDSRGPVDHPDSALVLRALTTTHSGDAFNLERLEMLGDAFLKLAVSLHLFMSYQDKDEGKLTKRKKNQISNLALYRAAAKKTLAGYQQCTQLARDNWCPTGCQFREVPQESITGSGDAVMDVDTDTSCAVAEEMEVDELAGGGGSQDSGPNTSKGNTQVIADKSVADSIEALIGAYLISCGYLGALRFMKFLGLKILPEVDGNDDLSKAEQSKPGCYTRFWPRVANTTGASNSEDMVSGLENFENSIHYRFRSKLYLLEALTHASYDSNRVTPCYQRLEFLGDALLDFLVTQHLYFRHAKLSPGELTDIRQALVNNNIFATIAVKYEYNKYLKQKSPGWFKTIENFITRVEDEAEERKQNHKSQVGRTMVRELDVTLHKSRNA